MSFVLLFHYLLLNMFRMLVQLVTYCGFISCVVLLCKDKYTNKSQAPKDGYTNIRNMLSSK